MSDLAPRAGVLAGGNFLVDQVKVIDAWPEQDALANILSQTRGNGGGPYNVLKNLSRLKMEFPLAAIGLVGQDEAGDFIRNDLAAHGIDHTRLQLTEESPTSATDVMTVHDTGRRTFFHGRGANALLDTHHFDFANSNYRIFYLAYLMLLDTLDALQEDGSTKFATVLQRAKESGHLTIADAVTVECDDYATVIESVLPYLDVLVLNEWETGRATGRELFQNREPDLKEMRAAAQQLHSQGETQTVVIHFPQGAYALSRDGEEARQGSVDLPPGLIAGAVGAGDAFCAGLITGLHDPLPIKESLERSVCVAASCLLDSTSSNGVLPIKKCLDLGAQYGFRPTVE